MDPISKVNWFRNDFQEFIRKFRPLFMCSFAFCSSFSFFLPRAPLIKKINILFATMKVGNPIKRVCKLDFQSFITPIYSRGLCAPIKCRFDLLVEKHFYDFDSPNYSHGNIYSLRCILPITSLDI